MSLRFLADLVLIIHAMFIAFVVFGLVLVLLGGVMRWRWVRNRWFRLMHLGAIVIVVLQAWFGVMCPLTTLESHLREEAGQPGYELGFIADYLHRMIFFDAPMWMFTVGYSVFGLLVVLSLWTVKPRWHAPSKQDNRV